MGNILKTTLILSAIAGLAAGFLALIPFLTPLVFFLLFIIPGAGVIVYLKKNSLIGLISVQDGTLIGAVAGFTSLTAAAGIYLPFLFLFDLFFGAHSFKYIFGNSFANSTVSLFMVVILVFFTALLSAVFNAFTGMVAAYIYEKTENKPFEFHTHFEIEQDD